MHLSHAALSGGTSSSCSPFHPSPGHPLGTKKLQAPPVPRPHNVGTLQPTFNKTCDYLVRSTHTKFAYDLAMDLKFPGTMREALKNLQQHHKQLFTSHQKLCSKNWKQPTPTTLPKQTTHKTQKANNLVFISKGTDRTYTFLSHSQCTYQADNPVPGILRKV